MINIRLTTSATQIDQWLMCKRKWVAGYLLDLKQPQTEAMAFGEVGHKYLEIYQRTGKLPDENAPWQFTKDSKIRYPGKSAKKALKHILAPHMGRPEHGFKFNIKGIEFIGYIDLEWSDNQGLWVTDYKFTSSLTNAMAEDTLAANVQATIYSTKAILEHKVKEVNLKWIYILSSAKPSVRPVITRLTEEQTKSQLRVLIDICEEMITTRDELNEKYGTELKTLPDEIKNDIINSIEPTIESCSMYNGCYYCNRCQLTDEQLMNGDMNDMDKNIESKLKDLGLDQFIKPKNKPVKEVQEAKAETVQTTKEKTNNKQICVDDFLKEPKVHTEKPKEKREEPKVQLNAPEHYVDETHASEPSCKCTEETKVVGHFSRSDAFLTDEEKKVLKALIDRL